MAGQGSGSAELNRGNKKEKKDGRETEADIGMRQKQAVKVCENSGEMGGLE